MIVKRKKIVGAVSLTTDGKVSRTYFKRLMITLQNH